MYLKEELALKSSQKFYKHTKTTQNKGRSSGRVVSVIAFFSDDPSSNLPMKQSLKVEINEKRLGIARFQEQT